MTILAPSDYKTNYWSGGSTAQIYIEPAGATLQARDFVLRLSMATIELEESTFTPFPGYARYLCVLTRPIRLEIKGEMKELSPGEILHFKGEDQVKSFGQTVDFGVIYRPELKLAVAFEKGEIQGPCIAFDPTRHTTFLLEKGEMLAGDRLIVLRRDSI